jgi:hypothetical protein
VRFPCTTSAISDKQEDKWPDNQLADFLTTRCDDIWNLSGHDVEKTRCSGCAG